jgi:hypothetical protein
MNNKSTNEEGNAKKHLSKKIKNRWMGVLRTLLVFLHTLQRK